MKLFLIGDYQSNTGPANVTRALLKELPGDTLYLKYRNKIARLLELFFKIPACDICLLSGYSRQNLYALRLAGLWSKPVVYLMHGCVEYENGINHEEDPVMTATDRKVLAGCCRILAVSDQFRDWLKEFYPEHADKIETLANGVDWEEIPDRGSENVRTAGLILSVGGGMPRKRILQICRGMELLQQQGITGLKLMVAGLPGADSEAIRAYSFVEDLGCISRQDLLEVMRRAQLFIQNSCFETFGLAPIEALTQGCSVLLSDKVGALTLMSDVREGDLIRDCENPDEIAEKIRGLLERPNGERILAGIDRKATSWRSVSIRLQSILKQIVEERS